MFSRRQTTTSHSERRHTAVAVVWDTFASGLGERKIPRRSALASRRGLCSAWYGLGADLAVHKAVQDPLRRQNEQLGVVGKEMSNVGSALLSAQQRTGSNSKTLVTVRNDS